MKKVLSFLLCFILLFNSFLLTVNASELSTDNDIFTEIGENSDSIDMYAYEEQPSSNGEYFIRRGFYSFDDTTGNYKNISATSHFTDDLSAYSNSINIYNTYSFNSEHKYFFYYNITKTDSNIILEKGHNARIEIKGFQDKFTNDGAGAYFTFNPFYNNSVFNSTEIKVGYFDTTGKTHFLYSVSIADVLVYNTSSGTYDFIFYFPDQGVDISKIFFRIYWDLDDVIVPNELIESYSDVFAIRSSMINGSFCFKTSAVDESAVILNKHTGLLERIIQWFEDIFEFLNNIPTLVSDAFIDLFATVTTALDNVKNAITSTIEKIKTWLTDLGNTILDGLKSLFLLPEGYFITKFDDLYDRLTKKLGILAVPLVLIEGIVNAYINLPYSDGIIEVVPFFMNGINIFSIDSVNFGSLLNNAISTISAKVGFNIYNTYLVFVDVAIILGFVNYCRKKYNSIIGGR